MEQKDSSSSQTDLQLELVLVDDALIQRTLIGLPDLYLQLVKEPSFVKKDSLKYDYRPSPLTFTEAPLEQIKEVQPQNFSQAANIVMRTIKCNCSRTKCQKNYCQCFKAGLACGSDCSCNECCNDEAALKALPKRNSGSGCKCQKSHCMKNYCECHSGGRRCTEQCRCIQCHNTESKLNTSQEEQHAEIQSLSRPRKRVKKERELSCSSSEQKGFVYAINRII